jgi:hypothetical protein
MAGRGGKTFQFTDSVSTAGEEMALEERREEAIKT